MINGSETPRGGRLPLHDLDGAAPCIYLGDPGGAGAAGRRRNRPGRRPRSAALAGMMLGALVLAAAAVGPRGGSGELALAGNARGEPIEIQVRNRSRGETGLISRGDGYALRFSNVKQGRGGGLISGCRAAAGREACIHGENLRDGHAFLFRSAGVAAGRFEAQAAGAAPFTTNATGLVENLNADRVDGLDASELRGQRGAEGPQGPQGPEGPQGPQGPQGVPGPTASAADEGVTDVTIDTSLKQVLATTIELGFRAHVLATATAEIRSDGGGNDQAFCFLDGPTGQMSRIMTQDIPETTGTDVVTIPIAGSAVLDPGMHTITVKCAMNTLAGDGTFLEGNVIAWGVAS